MKIYFINKNDIQKKLNFLLKKSNLSLEVFKELSNKEIYKLLKMLSYFDNGFKLKRKELKSLSFSLFEYSHKEIISNEIEELIQLEFNYEETEQTASLFEIIISKFNFYFFDKKQIIRC